MKSCFTQSQQFLCIQIGLNVSSDFIDLVTSPLKGPDPCFSGTAVFGRPLEKAAQIVANVIDRVQIKDAVRTENCLFGVFKTND